MSVGAVPLDGRPLDAASASLISSLPGKVSKNAWSRWLARCFWSVTAVLCSDKQTKYY